MDESGHRERLTEDLRQQREKMRTRWHWRLSAVEFVGSAFMAFVGCSTIISLGSLLNQSSLDQINIGRLLGTATSHGMMAAALYFAGFAVATRVPQNAVAVIGREDSLVPVGHFNPVITFALGVTLRIPLSLAASFFLAQLLGAFAGASLAAGLIPDAARFDYGLTTANTSADSGQAFVAETLSSFILVFLYMVLTARTAISSDSKHYIFQLAPLVLGFATFVLTAFALPVSGAVLNPFRNFPPAIFAGIYEMQWLFWMGPTLGASAAALVYRALAPLMSPQKRRRLLE